MTPKQVKSLDGRLELDPVLRLSHILLRLTRPERSQFETFSISFGPKLHLLALALAGADEYSNLRFPRMSLRRRALLAIGFAAISFFGFLMPMAIASDAFWPTILIPIGAGFYLLWLRCPNCGTPIFKRRVRLLGEHFTYWGGFSVPKKCSQCGKEL